MRELLRTPLLIVAAAIAFGACNCKPDHVDPTPDGSDPELAELRLLSIAPADVTLTSVDGVAATQAYTVKGHYKDDSTKDLTDKAVLSIDNTALGGFSGATFTASTETGGTSQVRATFGTFSAEATVRVVIKRSVKDDGPGSSTLPANPGPIFEGAPEVAARAPSLVYPNDGVLVPPNLSKLEFHFRKRHASNTLFELSFTNAVTDVRIFLRCHMPSGVRLPSGVSDGCIYTPSAAVWAWLSETNRGGEPLTVRVRGTDDAGSAVGSSSTLSVQIARSELKGALYYWSTTDAEIMRYDFAGPPDAQVEVAIRQSDAGGSCVGCHALSRNGKKIFATAGGQDSGKVLLYDLAADAPLVPFNSTQKLQFAAWNKDSSRFVGVYGDSGATDYNIMMFDGNSGQRLHTIGGTGTEAQKASHPDWAPDDSYLLWTRTGQSGVTNQRPTRGEIQGRKVLGDNDYGPVEVIIPRVDGKNHYYPAIAPDSKYLVYNQSTCASGSTTGTQCNSDTDPSAMLWAAKVAPSAQQIQLARANAPGVMDGSTTRLVNTYPKWSPFEVRGSDGPGSRLHWLTFASARQYGLRSVNPASGEYDKGTWIWMAAVDPDKVAAGQDGSFPAFAMPYQDLSTSNHIAQWAQYAVVDGCRTEGDGCGAGGSCCNGLSCSSISTDPPLPCEVEGNCICRQETSCNITGESCSASSPCCGTLSCNNASGGGACTGADCVCQPACGALGQACGGGSACCNGLVCLNTAGATCTGDDCVCKLGID